MAQTACGDIITIVRDQIPDPVYSTGQGGGANTGDSLPQVDGNLFRSQSLIRWVNEGVKVVVQQTGFLIDDVLPITVTTNQPYYAADSKWVEFNSVWYMQFLLPYLDYEQQIGPYQLRGTQASWWGYQKTTDHLQIAIQPIPSVGDQVTTLTKTYNSGDGILNLTSAVSFNSYGWIQIVSGNTTEILAYQTVSGSTATNTWQLLQVTDAQAGTVSANFNVNGANAAPTINHMGLWCKGKRMPIEVTTVTGNTGTVELPTAFVYAIQLYVLWKCRTAENDYQEAAQVYKMFTSEVERIKANPQRIQNQGMQVKPYGSTGGGPLAWGFVITR